MLGLALAALSVLGSTEPVGFDEQRRIVAHAHELLVHRDFVGLQKEIDGLLESRLMTVNGRRSLEGVVDALAEKRDIWEPIKAWTSLPQAGHAAFVLEGAYFIKEAWRVRGNGYAHTVSEHGSEEFERSLQLARAALEKAWRMQPHDPNAPALLITVAMGLGSPEEEMETWFGRAVAADPLAYAPYENKLTYLLPKWGGSEAKSAAFADQCDQKGPAGGRAYTVKISRYWDLARWAKNGKARQAFLEAPSVRADVDRLLARWLKDFPRSPEAHFVAAQMALSRFDEAAGRASLDRALALSPDYAAALLESAQWRARTKDYAGATKELERVAQLDPDNPKAFMWLGYSAEARGLDTALGYYDRAVSLDPTAAEPG